MRTIILTGGGTAGHILPNLALLPNLKKHFERIVYIGSEKGMEKELAGRYPELDYRPVTVVKLRRKLTLKNLAIPFLLLKGTRQAKKILAEIQPDVVFSKGGYVSIPVVLAAHRLGIPVVSHESDLTVGLANRFTKNKVKCICTTFEETANSLKNGVFVGSPIRQELFRGNSFAARQKFGVPVGKPVLLVLGGSLGATNINLAVRENLDWLCQNFFVFHITGKGKTSQINHKNYVQLEFYDAIQDLFALANFAITRGGSNALWELASLGIPTLIIPLEKGSLGDQLENANYFEKKGLALTLRETQLNSASLKEKVGLLITHKDKFLSNLKKLPENRALEKLTEIILKYSSGQKRPS